MRQRIFQVRFPFFSQQRTVSEAFVQLEDQLDAAQKTSEPPAKRARTSTVTEPTAAASAGPSKGEEKKRKMQIKKIFDRLKKECKTDTCKFQGTTKSVKVDEVLEVAEFDALFSGKGVLIQPTPQNKPTSTVTIIRFNSAQAVALFGDEYKGLKGNSWTRGGGPSFSKSVKLGQVDVEIQSMEVNYSKNTMKCSIKFEVDAPEAGYCRGPSGRSMGWMAMF
ncbi:hypothetical protein BDZ89DRAFT_952302 [Hymenopellis radicata]|nr:hypothetical protein BDZ89DRAFT_952302 [Hymenopellis radicata]